MSIVGADPEGRMSMSACAVMDMAVSLPGICCVANGSAALADAFSMAALHRRAPSNWTFFVSINPVWIGHELRYERASPASEWKPLTRCGRLGTSESQQRQD
jgi:hypothetical protein